jgi:hypothetical protein
MLYVIALLFAAAEADLPKPLPVEKAVESIVALKKEALEQAKKSLADAQDELRDLRTKSMRAPDKKKAVAEATRKVSEAKDLVAGMTRRVAGPFPIDPNQIESFDFGPFAHDLRVIQVIDNSTILASGREIGSSPFLVRGMKTEGVVDGAKLTPEGVWVVTGRVRYKATLGNQKTVFLLQPVPDEVIKKPAAKE